MMQNWRLYLNLQKKCETVAHFYETIAHFFSNLTENNHFCTSFHNSINKNVFMTKAEIERKKTLGRSLYMSGMELTEIADQLGVSRQSVSKWCSADGWKEARAAKNISRPELVNKLLLAIDNLIAQVNESGDPEAIGALADKLSKLSSTIEKLDKKANVIDAIEVFMAFNKWIQDQACYDPEITPELIKAINKYQNKFLMEKMSHPAEL